MTASALSTQIARPTVAAKRAFFVCLAVVTALPLIGLGFGVGLRYPFGPHSAALTASLAPVLAATGVGHVASTAFLYVDGAFRPLIWQNRRRFFLWPAVAVSASLAAFAIGPAADRLFIIGFFAWQLWHYQRQNYGLIAFAAQDRRFGPLPREVSWMLNLGAGGGICAMLSGSAYTGAAALWIAGVTLLASSTIVLLYVLVISRRLTNDPAVLTFTVLGWGFFLPTLLAGDVLTSFWSYAIAHGAQYLIFMAVMARGSRFAAIGPVILAAVTVTTWLLFECVLSTAAGNAIYTGMVMGHFMIDAKVWKMREPAQRLLIRQRFKFLFS